MGHILKCHDIVKTDFVRGEDCCLFDSQGRRYVDFESGTWCAALGFNDERIRRTIETQLHKVMHLGTRYPNAVTEEAAVTVLDLVGMENGKCTFLSSGSEAVEFGVQSARLVGRKPFLLTFNNSYLAAYGSAGKKNSAEWMLFDWKDGDERQQKDRLDKIPFEEIGAFVLEPGGSGIGFVHFPPAHIVQEIAQRVQQAGGMIVVNEITTGMGRTGKWFGYQHYDIRPDIVALGKGLGNGYPISVAAMRAEVAAQLEAGGCHYAQSHQNDPLGCAVALEVIRILKEEKWVERGNETGAFFLEGLKRLQEKHEVIKEARGRGMLLALEFRPHKTLSAAWVYQALLEKGFLVGFQPVGNNLRFDPPLILKREEIVRLLECLDEILENSGK